MSRLTHTSINTLQVTLIVVGLLVVALVPRLFGDPDPWYVTAVLVAAIAVVHLVIFGLVRHHRRVVRQQAIAEVRLMLQDQIKNQLSIILTNTYMATHSHDQALYVGRINQTVDDISTGLDNLSDESLTRWQHHYNVEGQHSVSEIATARQDSPHATSG